METPIKFPPHFTVIGDVVHPDGESGMLLRSKTTNVYSFYSGGRYRSAPHKWAQDTAAAMGKPSDEIQDACIARMAEKGWQAIDVAHALPDMSESHICGYLSRRSTIASHKLQRIFRVLDLKLVAVAD